MPMDHKSNFAVTCNLLSQYMKEKGGVSSLGITSSADTKAKSEAPRTMNLLPSIETSGEPHPPEENKPKTAVDANLVKQRSSVGKSRAGQMTIFYAGKVTVFDNFPVDKAVGLMAIAGKPTSISTFPAPGTIASCQMPHHLSTASDLPIARRASLGRFLYRRKDRVASNAPYTVNCSSSSAPAPTTTAVPEKVPAWLRLAPTSSVVRQQ